jgi:hypothetical protein
MNDGGPCETPLIDLLRCIPVDAVYQWEDEVRGLRSYNSSPIGKHCHRAADEIERLRAALLGISLMPAASPKRSCQGIAKRALQTKVSDR